MGLVLNLGFMRSQLKAFLMLKLLSTKSGVGLIKIGFPCYLTSNGWVKLALHRPIHDVG